MKAKPPRLDEDKLDWAQVPAWLLYRAFGLVLRLFPLGIARGLMGGVFGFVGPKLDSANRRMTSSLETAFPDQSGDWIDLRRREFWRRLGWTVAESMKSAAVESALQKSMQLEAEPEQSLAAADPRGQLILMGHTGAFEVVIQMAPKLGRPVMGVYRPLKNKLIERDIQHTRRRAGVDMVSIFDPSMVRRASRHLQGGGALVLFVDQRWAEGELMPLFGKPALTSLSAGFFAALTGARVSTLFARRISRDRHVLYWEGLDTPDQREADWKGLGHRIMGVFHERLEGLIRHHPDDWFWLQDRWKP